MIESYSSDFWAAVGILSVFFGAVSTFQLWKSVGLLGWKSKTLGTALWTAALVSTSVLTYIAYRGGRDSGSNAVPTWNYIEPTQWIVEPVSHISLGDGGQPKLGHIDSFLRYRLKAGNYQSLSYFLVDGGFLIATGMERFEDDGRTSSHRYEIDSLRVPAKNFKEWVSAIAAAPEGKYRFFAFAVTNSPFIGGGGTVSHEQAKWLVHRGAKSLPDELAQTPATPQTKCTVMVFEFIKRTNSDPPVLKRVLDMQKHLTASKIGIH